MILLRALVLVAVVGCGKVSGVDQKADAVIIDWRTPNAIVTAEPPRVRSERILVGSQENRSDYRIPVVVEWTVQKGPDGCLRIQTVKIARTGGATSIEIYSPVVRTLDPKCTTRDPGRQETFERLAVSYCWRWNGASNNDRCAYSGGFSLSADDVGLEGIVDRVP